LKIFKNKVAPCILRFLCI